MAQTVSQSRFTSSLARRHGVIDLNNLRPDLKDALETHGVSIDDLKELAGEDQQVEGADEFEALFDVVDGFDRNGSSRSFRTHERPAGDETEPPPMTPAGELYAALKAEVEHNRTQARYQRPGSRSAPAQPAKTTADARVVEEGDRRETVDLDMDGVNQFALYPDDPDKGAKACFEGAIKQARDHNQAQSPTGRRRRLAPYRDAIRVAYAEDAQGRVQVDETQAELGRAYIDRALDDDRPVVVGVSYGDNAYNLDRLTDHFVTIDGRGYDDDGRQYYTFKDPGTGGREFKFYVDEDTGNLFKPATEGPRYVEHAEYQMTHVRTYR
jgi:hypothetical protein